MFQKIKQNLVNIPGWQTKRRLVVFESDDWGSIRLESRKTLDSLLKKGIWVDNQNNWRLDCLETKDDLEKLFSLLSKFKDKNGKHPLFTMNTVMGNPDFASIKDSAYDIFFHEHFFDSF